MPTWNPEEYLRFEEDRTRPSRDLAARVCAERVNTIMDLGCGPGNSTAVLAEHWPDAAITGLDSSIEMLDRARSTYPQHKWVQGDISQWADAAESYDLVFSNTALHWLGDHATLYPKLLRRVVTGGTLAIQTPCHLDEPFHGILCDLQSSHAWRPRLPPGGVRARFGHDSGFYYDILAPVAASINIWETKYTSVMPGVESIIDWLNGTALRPFFDVLPDEADRRRFVSDLENALRPEYKPRADGNVLFAFRRLFLVATC